MGPSAHFPLTDDPSKTAEFKFGSASQFINGQLAEETARMSVSPSYLYLDDEGYTRWQGETSGLPLLDFLVERGTSTALGKDSARPESSEGIVVPQKRRCNHG